MSDFKKRDNWWAFCPFIVNPNINTITVALNP